MDRTESPRFGRLLRAHRVAAGLSQEELAERAHLSRRTITNLERGVTAPYRETVALLAEALNLSASDRTELENAVQRARFRATADQEAAAAYSPPVTATGDPSRAVAEPITPVHAETAGSQHPPTREQRKHVTILFCDMTDSTALGEALDPEAFRALLARYFDRMQGIIGAHGGTVEKFIGDAVMAVFGVPQIHEDDALRAARAALEMQAALPEIGVTAHIGIQSGEVVTGTSGQLATGDAVNVASRLGQAAQPGEVLIGEETLHLAQGAVEVETVPPMQLKGKSEPVPAYRLIGVKDVLERKHRAPMIGRERELARLRLAFAQAVDDRSCQLFTIFGMAGVGKSRLVREFLGTVPGARVVRGRCLSYGEGITYWPVVEVLKQVDTLPADGYAATILRSVLGEVQAATSSAEIAWAFRQVLEEQAQKLPLIVVFDDIHWGEKTFLELIEYVADLSRDASILLLCMARPELLERRPGWGGGKWNATAVLLEPLNARETDQLLEALGGVPDSLRDRIRQAAEGNPLFVEEMLTLIRAAEEKEEVRIPPTIQTLLAARLDQLDPEERRILECGAVEGRVFHQSAVRVLAGENGMLQGKLLQLVRKDLVRPERAHRRGDEEYRFRHLLIRDAAYASLPKSVRAALHERFAVWLEERRPDQVELDEIVGHHLEQAAQYRQELGHGDRALAVRAGERLASAARRAAWRGDTHAAREWMGRALSLLRPLRLDVYLELDMADLQPTEAEALAIVEAAVERACATNDARAEAVARAEATRRRVSLGSEATIDEQGVLAREAITLLEQVEDHEGLVHAWVILGGACNHCGRYEEYAHACEQALYHARRIGRPGLFQLPAALVLGPRPADEALRTLDRLLVDEPNPWARLVKAELLAMLNRFEDAWVTAREASRPLLELADDEGDEQLAYIAALAGDYETAARYLRMACDLFQARRQVSVLSTYAPRLGRYLCMLGRYDEAEPWAHLGRELGDERDVATQIGWRQAQALICAHRGEHKEAEQLVRKALSITEQTDSLNTQGDVLCDLAQVLERAGRAHEAAAVLEQALERYERKKNMAMVTQIHRRPGVKEDTIRVL